MLALKVIEPAISAAWNNRTTLVMKQSKNRLCLDARELNKVTAKNAYPLPNIDGLLSRLDDTILFRRPFGSYPLRSLVGRKPPLLCREDLIISLLRCGSPFATPPL